MNAQSSSYKPQEVGDAFNPVKLVKAVNKVLNNESWIPDIFKWLIKSVKDIEINWLSVCMFFLLRWIHHDLIEMFINHSKQSGYSLWIDIDLIVPKHSKTLLEYSIDTCNYKIFKQLLPLNKAQACKERTLECISFWTIRTTSEIAIRKKMLADCLRIWALSNAEVIRRFPISGDKSFLGETGENELNFGDQYSLEEWLKAKLEAVWVKTRVEVLNIARLWICPKGYTGPWTIDPARLDWTINWAVWQTGRAVSQILQ